MLSSRTNLLYRPHDSAPPVPSHRDAAVRVTSNIQNGKKRSRYMATVQSGQAADLQSMIRKCSIPKLLYADLDVMAALLPLLRTCGLTETIPPEETRIDSRPGAKKNGSLQLR